MAREGRQNVTLAIYAVDVFDKITFVESVIFCRDRNQFFLATKLRIVQIELQFFKGRNNYFSSIAKILITLNNCDHYNTQKAIVNESPSHDINDRLFKYKRYHVIPRRLVVLFQRLFFKVPYLPRGRNRHDL